MNDPKRMTRRRFTALVGGAIASLTGDACGASEGAEGTDGRLTARPRADVLTSATGTGPLKLGGRRDAILQLPSTAKDGPLPLLVLLHGAGGNGESVLRRLGPAAGDAGVAVLAPDSRDSTWDAIRDGFGADVTFLDRALAQVFRSVSVDPARVAVGGFSDGATYALSLGLINGDLFRRVVAFSPGFLVSGSPHGHPALYLSHGVADQILPIDRCSRVLVPRLRRSGYELTFREFDGGHEVPPTIAAEGMKFLASTPAPLR